MIKQSQNASLEVAKRFFKKLLKCGTIGATGFIMLVNFTSCNKPTQKPSETPNPKPPIEQPDDPTPIEKSISIDKIYNDNFAGTSFAADILAAQNALANRVFDNLTPQIANITYDEGTKQLTFEINYVEDNKAKSGSMTFTAPAFFQQIRGKQAKALILEYAELLANSEVKESSVDEITAKIEKAIDDIAEQIATSFAAVKTNNIIVEKEQDPIPVETISFDELIADELGDYLGNIALLQEPSKQAIQQNNPRDQILDDFKIAIENNELVFYYNLTIGTTSTVDKRLTASTYKGSANEFEDLIRIATDPQALLNAYFTNSQQNNMAIELNSEEYRAILSICQTILSNVSEQSDKLSELNYKNFTNKELARHNNELSQEEALKFATKLGYAEDEVLGVYVGKSGNRGFDETFGTGYCNSFTLSVLSKDYHLYTCVVYVPHYSDSTQADYYRYFLKGENGKQRHELKNETTTVINGIIVDFADKDSIAQNLYAKYASINDLDYYLPLNLILDILPR